MKNVIIGAIIALSTATVAHSSVPCEDEFQAADLDGNGGLSQLEYCPDSDCPIDFSSLDQDASGELSYSEFSIACEA